MSDTLQIEDALKLARSLTTIEGFPRFEDAIMATAMDLVSWCRGAIVEGRRWTAASQAGWLVSEARLTWRKWSGTGDFLILFRTKFPIHLEAGNSNEFHSLGTAPPKDCAKCSDTGTVKRADGWHDWCDCEYGQRLEGETPGWLDLVNKHLARKPKLVRRDDEPINQQRLDAMKADEKRMVELAIDGAEAMLRDPRATKEQKKAARKLLKLYRPKDEEVS